MTSTLMLRDFCVNDQPWGTKQGQETYSDLVSEVDQSSDKVFAISLEGIRSIDGTFAREAIINLAMRYRGERNFLLTEVIDPDILDNLEMIATMKSQPLIVADGVKARFIGPQLSSPNQRMVSYILDAGEVKTSSLAKDLGVSVQNASTQLKKLTSAGYLIRKDEASVTGGKEFVYTTAASH